MSPKIFLDRMMIDLLIYAVIYEGGTGHSRKDPQYGCPPSRVKLSQAEALRVRGPLKEASVTRKRAL